jgi:RNA polymerase sigma-70 factor (ECF subfamily)
MQEQTDEQLVTAIQQGDVFAFELLVRRYQKKLHIFVLHIVRDEATAHDVVQESFINLYKTIDRVDTKQKFSHYVFAIARNSALSALRARRKTVPLDDLASAYEDEYLFEGLMQAERTHMVRSALGKLDTKYARLIKLYYFDDLSYEEMSKKLRLPLNTVRTHLRRAKLMLQKRLPYEKH